MKVNLILILTILLSASRTTADPLTITRGFSHLSPDSTYKPSSTFYCQCLGNYGEAWENDFKKDSTGKVHQSLESFRDTQKLQTRK